MLVLAAHWNQSHLFIICTETSRVELSSHAGCLLRSKCQSLWGFPNTDNCIRRTSGKRFCNMLTLVWRLFPVKPVLHHHCSCSQNWHHSPEMSKKQRSGFAIGKLKTFYLLNSKYICLVTVSIPLSSCRNTASQSTTIEQRSQRVTDLSDNGLCDTFLWVWMNSVNWLRSPWIWWDDWAEPPTYKPAARIFGHGPTCRSMSPGSIRPSAATAPPFIIEPMYMPPSPRSLLCPTMLIPRKLYFSTQIESGGWGEKKQTKWLEW